MVQSPRMNGAGNANGSGTSLPKYTVEDIPVPGDPQMDKWADYLRLRYSKRHVYYKTLSPSEQDHIRKEIRRIRYFRSHFKDYRVFATDQLPLVALLEDSRTKWRDIASKRSGDGLAQLQKEVERMGDDNRRSRSRQILKMVQHWRDKDYATWQESVSPELYMHDLDSVADEGEDDPRDPNYGYNGWLIAWEPGKGGTSVEHPLIHGSFPHQKISIQQLLYNKTGTPLKRDPHSTQFRYFHLPANSMQWVEDAISRYYDEDNVEFDGRKVLNMRSHAQRLLRHDIWRGQERGGAHLPAHSRQMGSRCAVIPSAPITGPKNLGSRQSESKRDVALFMPFLHWEVEKRLHRMAQFIDVAKSQNDHRERLRRASTLRYKGRMVDIARLQQMQARPVTSFETRPGGRTYWRPQNPLAKYIWYAAKLFQIIDEAADGRLIEHHLFSSAPLHMRRTLEQYYYWTASETSRRDSDQVVCRATRSLKEEGEATARVVMVDQLWLWILDENTVISSFPRRWGRNKPDPSAVHRGIRDRLGALGHDQIHSAFDLAFIVIDECSKVFFDRTKPLDQRPEVVNLFGSAISKIAENKSVAYEEFGNAVNKISIERMEIVEKTLRRSLNIGFEWSILVEAQQVIEELEIMQGIFSQQLVAINDLEKIIKSMKWAPKTLKTGDSEDDDDDISDSLVPSKRRALDRVASLIADMELRRDELKSMETLQYKTRTQLRELLDMKQQQANIIEAKAAIKRADESVLQGRSIIVFTVITIFFLPLSFFTSVFGMNAREISEDGKMPLRLQLTLMFSISSVIVVVSLALAFNSWIRTMLSVSFSMAALFIQEKLGLQNRRFGSKGYTSAALKSKQRAMFNQIEKQATMRRLTEISSRTRLASPRRRDVAPPPPVPRRRSSSWGMTTLANIGRGRRAVPLGEMELDARV
ncbi:hypothetical protein B0I35DRAFT_418300 [Stachybotrys elegans]|uniref:Uncharacterized protein n=1 Tax=Stachybotrys elegans TaxID=80388 RepID=A0A8K0T249_9HYPO|nr:hypothetical protein B0I35DRAFT_418300 [Stachybotrys elegans]